MSNSWHLQTGSRAFRPFGIAAALAACLAAAYVVVSTIGLTIRYHDPLPWFDEWATIDLLRAWRHGEISLWGALFSKHNEHRILFPRLVFFADALWFRGQGWLSLWASHLVQALHAAMFFWLVGRARSATAGTWIVRAAIVALMFSLGQVENFASGFQLQFFAVFASATATFLAFGGVVARLRSGRSARAALAGSLALATVATFTMANGILAAVLLPFLAVLARLGRAVVVLTGAWAFVLAVVYRQGPIRADQGDVLAAFQDPGHLAAYVATYVGNVLQIDRVAAPATIGGVVLAVAAVATLRAMRTPPKAESLVLLGVMLFVILSGVATATGRMEYGLVQALSSRYVTGAATFWAAALCYGWIDPPPGWAGRATRAAVVLCGCLLIFGACRVERTGRRLLAAQYALQVRAADVLLQGRDDPAALAAGAGVLERVERLTPFLRELGISIFAPGFGNPRSP